MATNDQDPDARALGQHPPPKPPQYLAREVPVEMVTFDFDMFDIPDGPHVAVSRELRVNHGRESGQPFYAIDFVIAEPDAAAGREVSCIFSFAPKALPFTCRRLAVLAGKQLPAGPVNIHDQTFQEQFLQRTATLLIGHRTVRLGVREPEVLAIAPASPPGGEPGRTHLLDW